MLSSLNEAHLLALYKQKLLSRSTVVQILKEIVDLRQQKYSELLKHTNTRGTYLLYENYLIEKLGISIAGQMHIGRSRNDMNATLFKLNMRLNYRNIYHAVCRFRKTLLKQAEKYIDLAMPIYSQYQVGQVGTYAYYLLALEEAFSRDLHYFKTLLNSLEESPLGSASGCGTSIPIDREYMAKLLGFTHCSNNALDAIASRDLALRLLSGVATIATTLSRVAQDYQLWTTQEFSLMMFPDELCGGSSNMPQKKNPYLLEMIKGRSTNIAAELVKALMAMHNVPFSNSVEVGKAALQGIEQTLNEFCDNVSLMDILIANATPNAKNMSKCIHKGVAMATGVAEHLVKTKSLPFRQVHHDIGAEIANAVAQEKDPADKILQLSNGLSLYKDIDWAHCNEYGGGPGKQATKTALQQALKRNATDIEWIKSTEKYWNDANSKLQIAVERLLKQDNEVYE